MHVLLLTGLLGMSFSALPAPSRPVIADGPWFPYLRTETFEVVDPNKERYLRKKRNKANRAAWRQ